MCVCVCVVRKCLCERKGEFVMEPGSETGRVGAISVYGCTNGFVASGWAL